MKWVGSEVVSKARVILASSACAFYFAFPSAVISAPSLSVERSGDTIILTWTNTSPGYVLESVNSLQSTDHWEGVAQTPQLVGNQLVVTQFLDVTVGSACFYRLVPVGSQAGSDYLIWSQNLDGSWGEANGTALRDTAGVVESLTLSGQTTSSSYQAALSALASMTPRNNDDTSRQAMALGMAGWDVSALASNLLGMQNQEITDLLNTNYPGRGWGLAAGFGNSTIDTALVLEALSTAGETPGLTVVLETLPASGASPARGLNLPVGSSNVVLTVRSVSGPLQFNLTYPSNTTYSISLTTNQVPNSISFPNGNGLATLTVTNLSASPASYTAELGFLTSNGFSTFQVTTPLTYLGLAQNADGGWGIMPGFDSQFMVSCEVVRALAAWGQAFNPAQILQSAEAYILAHQNADGGFSSTPGASDAAETSLAVLALLAANPATPLTNAANYLRSSQLPNGSWSNNAWQTAVAIQALRMPPVISPIPGQTVYAFYPFSPITLDIFAKSPDYPVSQLSWSARGNFLFSVNFSNRVAYISYSSSNNPSFSEAITFIATDPSGSTASTTATFTVLSNQPPVLIPIPAQSVGAPALFAPIYLDNYVVDTNFSTNQLTWTVTGNTNLVVSISNSIASITYPSNITSQITEPLTFTVEDPVGQTASSTTNFTVAPDQPPVVGTIPPQTVIAPYAFAPIALTNYVTSAFFTPGQMSWRVTGTVRLSVAFSNNVAYLTYAPNPSTNFTEQLTFIATDPAGKSGSNSVLFTVNSNKPPVVGTIPSQSVYVAFPFTPIVLDNYVTDQYQSVTQLTWSVSGNVHLSVAFTNRVAYISHPPTTTSNYTEVLTFTATDPFGLSGSGNASFTVDTNYAPIVGSIPGQTNQIPVPFATVNLDNYVSDPEEPATAMTWAVTGNVKLSVSITNGVATITYPSNSTNTITELLTFKATDPLGLSGSNSASFSAVYTPPDYVLHTGGSTNDFRVVTMSPQTFDDWVTYSVNLSNYPGPAVTFTNFSYTDEPPNAEKMSYTISAATNATLGTYPLSIEYLFYDSSSNLLGPLTNNSYVFRVQVIQ